MCDVIPMTKATRASTSLRGGAHTTTRFTYIEKLKIMLAVEYYYYYYHQFFFYHQNSIPRLYEITRINGNRTLAPFDFSPELSPSFPIRMFVEYANVVRRKQPKTKKKN